MNLPEVIFFYWLQALKVRFNTKDKMNLIPNGILFTQIMRNNGVDVFVLEPSAGPTQLNGLTFVKMGMADNFPEYAKKYNKRKIKKNKKHGLWQSR